MPYLWSLPERWDQLWSRMQRAGSGCSSTIKLQSKLLLITLASLVLSFALESRLLFAVLMVTQGLVLFWLVNGRINLNKQESFSAAAETLAGLLQRLPTAVAVRRIGYLIGTAIYRIVYRVTVCLLIALSAGLATLSVFALKQPEMWRWTTLQTAGPPLGALLVTGLVTLIVLSMSSWAASRWPLLPR